MEKNMQKKLTLLTFALLFSLAAMGAVSAADTPDNSTLPSVDPALTTPDTNQSSDVQPVTLNQTLPDPRIEHNGVIGATVYPTIQAAINAAQSGDTIWLEQNGVFHEYITVWKNLNFRVFNGGQATITGDNSRKVVQVLSGVTATFENITFTNGRDGTGAGIVNDGTLTLNNCAVTNNVATGYAGGILNYGTLTLNRCVISDNQAFYYGAGILNLGGTLNIYDSNLTGNVATTDTYYGYGGGAVFNYYGTLRIYRSNILNNHAYNAGAVYSNVNNVIMNFNRIVGNTQHTAYQVYSESSNINAEYNWWGSNSNPGASLYRTDADPWLVLTISANSPINNGDTSTITVDLTHTNHGLVAPGTVPDGTPVTFGFMSGSGPFGSLASPLTRTTTGGVASIVFTANDPNAPHSQVVTGTVDYRTGLASVLINPDVDLSITKTADQSNYNVGNTVTYTITVTNNGLNPATGVVVTDTLPAGLTIVDADGGSVVGNVITWNIANIAAGGQQVLTVTATVDAGTQGQTLTNTVSTGCPQDNEAHTATASIHVNYAVLSVNKVADQTNYNVGNTVIYDIGVFNSGPDAATNVLVSDTLPNELTFVSATNGGVWDPNTRTITWNIANLAANDGLSLSVTATVNAGTQGTNPQNTVTVTSDQGSTDQHTAIIHINNAILEIFKTTDQANYNVGDNVVYNITVDNEGPDQATNVVVTDTLPAGLTFVSATNGGVWDPSTRTITWNIGDLANQFTATVTATVTGDAAAKTLVNTATVDAEQLDHALTATASIYVPSADLVLTKTVDKTKPTVKDTIIYTLIVNNHGPDTSVNVTVFDKLPGGLTYVSHTANYGTYDLETGLWKIGNLPNGASAVLTITAVVDESGKIINEADVSTGTWDPNLNDNIASVVMDAQAKPVPVSGKTVAMQKTGAPIVGLLLAFFMLLAGMVLPRRK